MFLKLYSIICKSILYKIYYFILQIHTYIHTQTIIFLIYYLLVLLLRWGNELRKVGYLLKVTQSVAEQRFELKPSDFGSHTVPQYYTLIGD